MLLVVICCNLDWVVNSMGIKYIWWLAVTHSVCLGNLFVCRIQVEMHKDISNLPFIASFITDKVKTSVYSHH